DKLSLYQSKSTVVSSFITNVDEFSIESDESYAFVNLLKVMNSKVIQTQTLEIRKRLDETDEELLAIAIAEFRNRYKSVSREIIVPFPLDIEAIPQEVKLLVPKMGDKRKLLDLSLKNVAYFKKERMLQYERRSEEHTSEL